MKTAKKLRLGPLPKTESVKLTFACPASLKADLDRYASLHAQAYGEAVDAEKLIPHTGGRRLAHGNRTSDAQHIWHLRLWATEERIGSPKQTLGGRDVQVQKAR